MTHGEHITELQTADAAVTPGVVIIGAGQAAAELAGRLRQDKFDGLITIIGDEPHLPYQRPPLSKTFLAGDITEETLLLKPAAAYERANIVIRTSLRATAIDRHSASVALGNGETQPYGTLVIATGGHPRRMHVPNAGLQGIHLLRTIDDVRAIRAELVPGCRLVIVGGGYIGLEVAAIATKLGALVTVLEAAPRVLARVTAPEMSAFYASTHRAEGVEIRTGVAVSGFVAGPDGTRVAAVECGDGAPVPADIVIVGIGIIPNTGLAEDAGLMIDGGIVVDADGRTADPRIFAIGDCARHERHGFLNRGWRLESVPNAVEQARTVSAAITGKPRPEASAPWFWSDQYKLKLQMVGISEGYEEVVIRGSTDTGSFITFYLTGGVIIAADAVNRPAEFMASKRLVGERRVIAAADLADETRPLKSFLQQAG